MEGAGRELSSRTNDEERGARRTMCDAWRLGGWLVSQAKLSTNVYHLWPRMYSLMMFVPLDNGRGCVSSYVLRTGLAVLYYSAKYAIVSRAAPRTGALPPPSFHLPSDVGLNACFCIANVLTSASRPCRCTASILALMVKLATQSREQMVLRSSGVGGDPMSTSERWTTTAVGTRHMAVSGSLHGASQVASRSASAHRAYDNAGSPCFQTPVRRKPVHCHVPVVKCCAKCTCTENGRRDHAATRRACAISLYTRRRSRPRTNTIAWQMQMQIRRVDGRC